jgi:hypothetical protein
MSCETWDWIVTPFITVACLGIWFLERRMNPGKLLQLPPVIILTVYFMNYLYVVYLGDYFTSLAAAWIVSAGVAVVLLLGGFFLRQELIGTAVFVFMVTQGMPLYASIPLSILMGVLVWLIIMYQKIADLTEMLFNCIVLSMDIAISIVSMISNARSINAPALCESNHINMFIICSKSCESVLSDDDTTSRYYWGATALVLAVIRFGWLYAINVCNKPPQITKKEKEYSWCCCCINGYAGPRYVTATTTADTATKALECAEKSVKLKKKKKCDSDESPKKKKKKKRGMTYNSDEDGDVDEVAKLFCITDEKHSDDHDNDENTPAPSPSVFVSSPKVEQELAEMVKQAPEAKRQTEKLQEEIVDLV